MDEYQQYYSENDTQIKEKLIEPDIQNGDTFNRNFQMANINKNEQYGIAQRYNFAQTLLSYPTDKGGWILRDHGLQILKEINSLLALSLSVGAVGRRSVNTKEQKSFVQDFRDDSKWFGGIRRR